MSVSKEVKFDYLASPDGEEVFQKFGAIAKPVSMTAFALSTIDVMLYSHPKGYLDTIGRYAHCSWPVFGAAAAFVIGSNIAGSIRHKDDKWNWFIGGAGAGGVVGLWRKNTITGGLLALTFGVLALYRKQTYLDGTHMFYPDTLEPKWGGLRTVRQDWTLTKHRPGNWTTGEN